MGLAALGLPGCEAKQQAAITLAISADSIVSAAVDTLVVEAYRGDEKRFERTYKLPSEAVLPGTITFSKDDGLPVGDVVVFKVSGVVEATGEARVSRQARLGFVDEKVKVLRMPLRGDCLDVKCEENETCEGSVCVSDGVDPNKLPDVDDDPPIVDPFPPNSPLELISEKTPLDSNTEMSVSGDGRFVAFSVIEQTSGVDGEPISQVYVRDRDEGTTTLVSVNALGLVGNGSSQRPSISLDGRFIAFESKADNLVVDDLNEQSDVFIHDLLSGSTFLASLSTLGTQANGASFAPNLSASGRFVVFESGASNLVVGDDAQIDVFVRDLQVGVTVRVSVSATGHNTNGTSGSAMISANGRYVVFESSATNLVVTNHNASSTVFLRDMELGSTQEIGPDLSDSGEYSCSQPSCSADGQMAAFLCNTVSDDLSVAFIYDRSTGKTHRVGAPDNSKDSAVYVTMASNGKQVALVTNAPLDKADTNKKADLYWLAADDETGELASRLSLTTFDKQSAGNCLSAVVSADTRYVVFTSDAADLIPAEKDTSVDVFAVPTAP